MQQDQPRFAAAMQACSRPSRHPHAHDQARYTDYADRTPGQAATRRMMNRVKRHVRLGVLRAHHSRKCPPVHNRPGVVTPKTCHYCGAVGMGSIHALGGQGWRRAGKHNNRYSCPACVAQRRKP